MKFQSTFSSFLIGVVLFFLLGMSSCSYRYTYYDLEKSPQVDDIFLLQVIFKDRTDESGLVYYPSRQFMLKNFVAGLVEEFNSNQYGVKISTWDDLGSQKKFLDSKIKNQKKNKSLPYVYPVEKQSLVLVQAPRWSKIKNYRKFFKKNYYLALELNMWAWKQEVRGWFIVRDRRGSVVWREQLKHQSPYIQNDPKSPYLIKNPRLKKPPIDKDSNHYLEMEKTFKELGVVVGVSLKETLEKIQMLNHDVVE